MNLRGKAALVTGSSGGIGKSIALELAKAGAAVAVNYNKNEQGALETLRLIKDNGGYGIIIKGDVSRYNEARDIICEIVKRFGSIDILVNNAGISKVGLFMDMSEEEWSSLIDTNLKGVINCSHCAVKYMIAKKHGSIINISSIWGNAGASCEVIYSATKGAVNSFTKALAKELAASNVRVNAIAPGVIDTEMNNHLSNEEKESLKLEIPMMKFGSGEDIGRLAVFLASDASKYITGQVITVDGGMI
ncbi:SDR family oxidoreductase [Clostridium sp. SYSU_GA19001]|uniref:elongation factor P 5-aminopentanone reductase n=1 Tax=Clostridium caldaquaticum TaxID=2940653 RepID=UPI0020775068|nr:SDR family oxidoreductase [Clostridium caldaquaticum]MCM8709804.1 SDR family oxidoreductase [Clostridium caldaquaticum]